MDTISITPKTEKIVTLVTERGVICRNVLTSSSPSQPLRLTPTGKISHAKTRVYTQRYRREWEQMSDFQGWLTSVSNQPTRAYCLYCRKNLHAHRLSLLKHTCTMKHQRSALTYQLEQKQIQKSDADAPEIGLMEEVETYDSSQAELGEDHDDDIEYVVERLDTDEDDSMKIEDAKEKIEVNIEQEEEEEEEEEKDMDSSDQSNEDSISVIKKIKLSEEKYQDPLIKAMAHVHNEYLEEEVEDEEDVQVEMVMESTNNDISVLPELEDNVQKTSKPRENKKTVIKATKNGKVLLENSKDNFVTTSLPILSTAYQTNIATSITPTKSTMNYVPIAPNPNTQKTITLMCGNKTFTLTGGTFQPGTQYVLTKLKGNPTALMLTDQNKIINESENKIQVKPDSNIDQSLIIPSTSQQPVNQQSADTKLSTKKISGKSLGKPARETSRKLRISTYVVDNVKGVPISGLQVSLYKLMDGKWTFLNENSTNVEGHCDDLMEKIKGTIGRYKLHFDVDKYFTLKRIDTMFPFIEIVFDVKKPTAHYHIPLLLSPFGYTTYRGT
ncbi:PREDICTED: histone H3.v1-like isoform X3 [Trachymyrmex cornetzi]|nr:PREDICTED: histone H3.v1-like isoform X3 [Trachymyrmex cornetzi]